MIPNGFGIPAGGSGGGGGGGSLPAPGDAGNLLASTGSAWVSKHQITSPDNIVAALGVAVSYTPTATGSPVSWTCPGLPSGLSVNAGTGEISGTPSATGTTIVALTATYADASTATLAIGITVVSVLPTTVSTGGVLVYNGSAWVCLPTGKSALTIGANITIDMSLGRVFTGTLTGAATFAVSNTWGNRSFALRLTNSGTVTEPTWPTGAVRAGTSGTWSNSNGVINWVLFTWYDTDEMVYSIGQQA